MTDDGAGAVSSGTFWFAGGPHREGGLVSTASKTRVVTRGFVAQPHAFTFHATEGSCSVWQSGDVKDIVEDSKPRALWGTLQDGRDVTLMDCGMMDVDLPNRQVLEGSRLYVGGHIPSAKSSLVAARISLKHHKFWVQLAQPSSQRVSLRDFDGFLRTYEEDGSSWIELRADVGMSDREWERRFWYRVLNLLSTWSGIQAVPDKVQVLVSPNAGWCDLRLRSAAKVEAPTKQEALLSASALSVEVLVRALVQFEIWGSIAEKASQQLVYQEPLQFAVIGYAAALEGLHRRCFQKTKPLPALSRKMSGEVADAAAHAALIAATELGEDSASIERFKEAFRYFNEPTYVDRITELVEPLLDVAPGLFGDDFTSWADQLKRARNGEAHQLPQAASLDYEAEIDNLYQLAVSSGWALRLSVLLQLGVDASDLKAGLKECRRFEFVLANMDRCEFSWPGSRLDAFRGAP